MGPYAADTRPKLSGLFVQVTEKQQADSSCKAGRTLSTSTVRVWAGDLRNEANAQQFTGADRVSGLTSDTHGGHSLPSLEGSVPPACERGETRVAGTLSQLSQEPVSAGSPEARIR